MHVEQKAHTLIEYTHQLFELQSVKRPHALAIDSPGDGTRLSYAELNQQANQYAHYFLSLGIGPESLVGVFLQNSVARIVILLAIHKAGSGYVLLNASRQDLRGNETMGERVWKSEEKEGKYDSPNHFTPVRSSNPCRAASTV